MEKYLTENYVDAFLSEKAQNLNDEVLVALLGFATKVIRYRFRHHKIPETDIETLALDAVEAAWQSRHSFRREAQFTTWFSRIIVRVTWKYAKRWRTDTAATVSLSHDVNDDEGWREIQLVSNSNPAETVRIRMLWEYATTILSPRQLQAFEMMQNGDSEEEIGRALGATGDPAETAKQLIKVARVKLRKIFDMTQDEAGKPRDTVKGTKL